MRRLPIGRAPSPAYPRLSRAPWAVGLLAAGTVALSGCRTACEPAAVQAVEDDRSIVPGGVAPRIEPLAGEVPVRPEQGPSATPPAATIPEVVPPPETFRTAGVPREPTLPEPPVPAPPVEGDVVAPVAP